MATSSSSPQRGSASGQRVQGAKGCLSLQVAVLHARGLSLSFRGRAQSAFRCGLSSCVQPKWPRPRLFAEQCATLAWPHLRQSDADQTCACVAVLPRPLVVGHLVESLRLKPECCWPFPRPPPGSSMDPAHLTHTALPSVPHTRWRCRHSAI